ncbi:hypothetical protein BKA70DRAFT_1221528 [Coprinopsis sp. MPI-PUGE-AT-0042]|nr:hypothetical protein BKA70DRAFT_1221528 [Coprinopsis sp. MPI-PUGE-AT-0042]
MAVQTFTDASAYSSIVIPLETPNDVIRRMRCMPIFPGSALPRGGLAMKPTSASPTTSPKVNRPHSLQTGARWWHVEKPGWTGASVGDNQVRVDVGGGTPESDVARVAFMIISAVVSRHRQGGPGCSAGYVRRAAMLLRLFFAANVVVSRRSAGQVVYEVMMVVLRDEYGRWRWQDQCLLQGKVECKERAGRVFSGWPKVRRVDESGPPVHSQLLLLSEDGVLLLSRSLGWDIEMIVKCEARRGDQSYASCCIWNCVRRGQHPDARRYSKAVAERGRSGEGIAFSITTVANTHRKFHVWAILVFREYHYPPVSSISRGFEDHEGKVPTTPRGARPGWPGGCRILEQCIRRSGECSPLRSCTLALPVTVLPSLRWACFLFGAGENWRLASAHALDKNGSTVVPDEAASSIDMNKGPTFRNT